MSFKKLTWQVMPWVRTDPLAVLSTMRHSYAAAKPIGSVIIGFQTSRFDDLVDVDGELFARAENF